MFENKIDNNQGLNLFFEGGKAQLYWKGLELTKNLGLHTAFNIDEKWHVSSEGQWLASAIAPGKFHLSINYGDIGVIQSWLLTLAGNDELLWEADMQVKQPLYILDRKIGLFLSDNYGRWFHFSDQGKFPQAFNWDDVPLKKHIFLNKIGSSSFGVMPSVKYPGISFEVDAQGTPLLQNTNEEIKARAVQFKLNGINQNNYYETGMYKWCSGKIKVIENEGAIDSHIENLREKIFAAKVFEHGRLKLYFDERKASLYWNDLELTKHFALNTVFSFNEEWYGSSHKDWRFIKIDEEKLYIIIDYDDIPVTHNWLLIFTGQDEFTWEVEMRVKKPAHIQQKKFGLFLSDKYTRWFNSAEEGEFPAGFNWENIFLNYTDSGFFGVRPCGNLPGILFEVSNTEGKPLLQNTNKEYSARVVQFELKDKGENGYYEPGSYKWCSGKIKVIEDEKSIDYYIDIAKKKLAELTTFEKDKLRLFFDKGKAAFYWNQLELTKNLGLHTSINVEGNWHDSSRAEWQFKKIGQEKLYIDVKYRDIPVTHSWLFNFIGANEFSLEVDMEVGQRLLIRHSKVSLFISDRYTHWFNSSEQGEFPRGFNWEKIYLNHLDSRGFGVKPNGGYPGILVEVNSQGIPLIQNTNEQLSGRAIQFELKKNGNDSYFAPGNYKYFSGKIKLIEDERIINEYISNCKLLPVEHEPVFIFGDTEELHNRIAAAGKDDFKDKVSKVAQILGKNKKLTLKIGVSRFNFFRIKEIVDFSLSLLGRQADLKSISLNLFPVTKLYYNFVTYLEEIKAKINNTEIKLVSIDEGLFDLLLTVSGQAHLYNEKKLLRLLGVISEHAFIGPQIVVVDPHHRCNVNCLHCWIHTPKIKHTEEFLAREFNFELYKQMINDFSELKVDSILFQGDGEPLLYDKFFDMVKYARGKNIEVIFFTNGLLLDKKISEEVVGLEVGQIFCSLPAGTENTYALVTDRKDTSAFGKVLSNLKYLTSVKRRANTIYPKLIMTHVIHTLNHKEIVEMAKNDVEIGADVIRFYLIRLDDNIKFLQLKPDETESIKESMCEVKAYLKDKHVELLDTTDFQLNHYEKETGAWSKGVFLNEGCLLGWFFCLVPALGDISLCCHLRTVGYLKEKTFKEIWNSKEYQRYRVQAKYLKDNKDVTFLNGVKLYDEHCEHCDTHQVIRDIKEDLKNYDLERFV